MVTNAELSSKFEVFSQEFDVTKNEVASLKEEVKTVKTLVVNMETKMKKMERSMKKLWDAVMDEPYPLCLEEGLKEVPEQSIEQESTDSIKTLMDQQLNDPEEWTNEGKESKVEYEEIIVVEETTVCFQAQHDSKNVETLQLIPTIDFVIPDKFNHMVQGMESEKMSEASYEEF